MLFWVSGPPKLTIGTKNHNEIFHVTLPLNQAVLYIKPVQLIDLIENRDY